MALLRLPFVILALPFRALRALLRVGKFIFILGLLALVAIIAAIAFGGYLLAQNWLP